VQSWNPSALSTLPKQTPAPEVYITHDSPYLTASARRPALDALSLPDGDCRLVVDGVRAHALLDLSGHGQESLFDVRGALCGGLEEGDSEAVGELL
jgi:hypothetical protein